MFATFRVPAGREIDLLIFTAGSLVKLMVYSSHNDGDAESWSGDVAADTADVKVISR